MDLDLLIRKFELMRMRWGIANGRVKCHPDVKPAALDWLDGEIAAIEKASSGLGAA